MNYFRDILVAYLFSLVLSNPINLDCPTLPPSYRDGCSSTASWLCAILEHYMHQLCRADFQQQLQPTTPKSACDRFFMKREDLRAAWKPMLDEKTFTHAEDFLLTRKNFCLQLCSEEKALCNLLFNVVKQDKDFKVTGPSEEPGRGLTGTAGDPKEEDEGGEIPQQSVINEQVVGETDGTGSVQELKNPDPGSDLQNSVNLEKPYAEPGKDTKHELEISHNEKPEAGNKYDEAVDEPLGGLKEDAAGNSHPNEGGENTLPVSEQADLQRKQDPLESGRPVNLIEGQESLSDKDDFNQGNTILESQGPPETPKDVGLPNERFEMLDPSQKSQGTKTLGQLQPADEYERPPNEKETIQSETKQKDNEGNQGQFEGFDKLEKNKQEGPPNVLENSNVNGGAPEPAILDETKKKDAKSNDENQDQPNGSGNIETGKQENPLDVETSNADEGVPEQPVFTDTGGENDVPGKGNQDPSEDKQEDLGKSNANDGVSKSPVATDTKEEDEEKPDQSKGFDGRQEDNQNPVENTNVNNGPKSSSQESSDQSSSKVGLNNVEVTKLPTSSSPPREMDHVQKMEDDVQDKEENFGDFNRPDDDNQLEEPKLEEPKLEETPSFYPRKDKFEPTPPESHFLFYFFTVAIVCVFGYLVFHNKKKIIALVIEGRSNGNGRRRRPSSNGYKRLDDGSRSF